MADGNKDRIERDSMGEVRVPKTALYGAQTQRAVDNFSISQQRLPPAFLRALVLLKSSAAEVNGQLQLLSPRQAQAILKACDTLLADEDLQQHFPVDVFQTGSGTSTNMNANEVIAHLASEACGEPISPNDHVNLGQSSNDVIPTVIHLSASIALKESLFPALVHMESVLDSRATQLDGHIKTGRTHLMDAMPVSLGQVLRGWKSQFSANREQLSNLQAALGGTALGGTAVGTGVNAHPDFARGVGYLLCKKTGLTFGPAADYFAAIGSQDTAVAVSGQLKTLAVTVLKIANDLRWMNSGPLAGFGEIELEALQPGSSIMPGKVNPVLPEAAAMVAAQVIGNDTAITVGGQSGNFELNVMLPLIAKNLLESTLLLANVLVPLADRAVATFKVNEANLAAPLQKNPILVTALNPVVGYLKAAEIAKEAYASGRPVVDVAVDMTELSREELEDLLDPAGLV